MTIARAAELRRKITKASAQRDVYKEDYDRVAADYYVLADKSKDYKEAVDLLWAVVESKQKDAKKKIEDLVTAGLRAVFGREDMTFILKATGKSAARKGLKPLIECRCGDYEFVSSIPDGHGGGVADVTSFLLRVVMMSLLDKPTSPLIILDENFKHVSVEFLNKTAMLVKELSDILGIQFIIVTHKSELLDSADVIYRAKMDKNGFTIFSLEHDMVDSMYHDREHKDVRQRASAFDMIEINTNRKPTKINRGDAK